MKTFELGGIKLGKKYIDVHTDIAGTATSYTKHITGCDRVCLEYVNGNGEVKYFHTDITRLKGVSLKKEEVKSGGPQPIDSGKDVELRR